MVSDARCWTCGGVKIPNGTTTGEPPCRCASVPPVPYPPQEDQPIRIGSYNGFGFLICAVAALLAFAAYCLTHPH